MSRILEKPLILVDGSYYLYRAYHAFPPLTNSANEPTGAMYGVLHMLRNLLLKYQPSHAAIIFDAKGKTFRDELFSEYKSNRPPMPNDLRTQMEPLHKIVKAIGIPVLIMPGVEADDVIGTLSLEAEMAGNSVLISTQDKDMAQLVTSKTMLIHTMNNNLVGPKEVYEKYGVPTNLIVDLLALIGDSSDNIPGVRGIGKKTAIALLKGLGGLSVIYNNLESVSTLRLRGAKSLASLLEKYKKVAYLSQKLATIKTNVNLEVSFDDLNVSPPCLNILRPLFKRYEFTRWLEDLEDDTWLKKKKTIKLKRNNLTRVNDSSIVKIIPMADARLPYGSYVTILDEATLVSWIERLKKANIFAFNIRTDGSNLLNFKLVGFSFAMRPGEAAYLPVAHCYEHAPLQLEQTSVLKRLKVLLEDPVSIKIVQNLKFCMGILGQYGINLSRGITYDTMIESYVLDSVSGCQNMHDLADRYLGHKSDTLFVDIPGKGKKHLIFSQVKISQATRYSAEDVDVTLRLHLLLWPILKKNSALLRIFNEIDMPLIRVLLHIEENGVLINPDILMAHSQELKNRLGVLEIHAYKLAGEHFNLASTKQLQVILYEKQKLPVLKKTPSGAPSTNEEVLATLALNYDLPKIILKYRSLAKLKTTYADKLPLMIHPVSGRIHTCYHQATTVTGRLSSSHPNLQNIPVRDYEGRRIRKAFVAPQDYLIVAADYSQIELRIMAHLSQDIELIKAFFDNQDVHCATASDVFCISLNKVTREQRRGAKAINFGLMYGMSTFGLARQLRVAHRTAQLYIERYFKRYSGVLDYMNLTRQKASKYGYVTTINGRRLYLPDSCSSSSIRRKSSERAAINAPMQGTAADIIKRAMIKVDSWIQEQEQPLVRMIMQVHDELVFEVHKSVLSDSINRIRELMEGSMSLSVPLKVDIGVGNNWDEAH